MSLQMFRKLEGDKEKMIKTAKNCFETANNVRSKSNILVIQFKKKMESKMHFLNYIKLKLKLL